MSKGTLGVELGARCLLREEHLLHSCRNALLRSEASAQVHWELNQRPPPQTVTFFSRCECPAPCHPSVPSRMPPLSGCISALDEVNILCGWHAALPGKGSGTKAALGTASCCLSTPQDPKCCSDSHCAHQDPGGIQAPRKGLILGCKGRQRILTSFSLHASLGRKGEEAQILQEPGLRSVQLQV